MSITIRQWYKTEIRNQNGGELERLEFEYDKFLGYIEIHFSD